MSSSHQLEIWQKTNQDSIDHIEDILKISSEPYDDFKRDFVKLATWLFEQTDCYLYLPGDWKDTKESPQRFSRFLMALENTMVNGSGILFVKSKESGSFLELNHNQKQIEKEIKNTKPAFKIERFHTDVDQFIKDCQYYRENPPPFKPK